MELQVLGSTQNVGEQNNFQTDPDIQVGLEPELQRRSGGFFAEDSVKIVERDINSLKQKLRPSMHKIADSPQEVIQRVIIDS